MSAPPGLAFVLNIEYCSLLPRHHITKKEYTILMVIDGIKIKEKARLLKFTYACSLPVMVTAACNYGNTDKIVNPGTRCKRKCEKA